MGKFLRDNVSLGELYGSFLKKQALLPKIKFTSDAKNQEVFVDIYKRIFMASEEFAGEFAIEAEKNMIWHIDRFSLRTRGGKRSTKTTTGEYIRKGGLRDSIGSEVEDLGGGKYIGAAGVGLGGKKEPLNTKGKPYAFYVDRGFGQSEGRYVPIKYDFDVETINGMSIGYRGVYREWMPKFHQKGGVWQEQWWGADRKRPMWRVSRWTKEMTGRVFMGKPWSLIGTDYSKARESYSYASSLMKDITRVTVPRDLVSSGVVYPYEDVDWLVRYGSRKYPGGRKGVDIEFRKMIAKVKKLKRKGNWTMAELDKIRDDYYKKTNPDFLWKYYRLMGGEKRGYGGLGNLKRSLWDVAYVNFLTDFRVNLTNMLRVDPGVALLAGFGQPADKFLSTKIYNRRGLGKRISRTRGGSGDIGLHPGGPARNFVLNTAQHMREWTKAKMREKLGLGPKPSKYHGLGWTRRMLRK